MSDPKAVSPFFLPQLTSAFDPILKHTAGAQTAVNPVAASKALAEYLVDAAQRSFLLLDILRERGDEQADIASRPLATVLRFDHEILLSGRSQQRPFNYTLSRIIPPAGAVIDPKKRPVVVVDPRAGQGPGIGGFHRESEIGDAFDAGHPVYFIGHAAEPVEGQTFFDVVEGQVRFFERVVELHPDSPRPLAIGNCQAGYQTLMVAMLRPDLFGLVLMPGSPISYWQGVHGKNPMRYAGGLLGGSWLAALSCDLGNGKFDGANLIANFDNLNPGNTFFSKMYNVYKQVDTQGPRFLQFEKWWGDFIQFNGEEIQYLVNEHFIGNKLDRNQIATSDGRLFDIRNVTSPIVVFTSLGDNISPPQQTLGWIIDLYDSVDDIRAQGKTIVYCIDPKVGHLAIFVSPKVAVREHEALIQTSDIIDCLPPGLYELVVTPKTSGEPGANLVAGDFLAKFEARTLDDLRAYGRNSEADDVAFATAARVSEIGLATYRTYVQPLIKAIANEQLAALTKALNPVRLQYTMFTDANPLLKNVAGVADKVRAERKPVQPDNPFLQLQETMANAIVTGWNAWRDARDKLQEQTFFAIYNSPILQALVGTGAGVQKPHHPPAKTAEELAAAKATLAGYRADIAKGGPLEAKLRALLYVLEADRAFDERSAFAIRTAAPDIADVPLAEIKRTVREQFFALQLDQQQAVNALPALVPDAAQRAALLKEVQAIVDAAGTPTPETARRLQSLASLLGQKPVPAQIAAAPQPAATKGEAARKPVTAGE
jgi:hypothetical protein